MQLLYNNIPALLKLRPNWVAWGIRDSPLKSPFNPASPPSSNDSYATVSGGTSVGKTYCMLTILFPWSIYEVIVFVDS